jgi:hypothetical protein
MMMIMDDDIKINNGQIQSELLYSSLTLEILEIVPLRLEYRRSLSGSFIIV